MHEAVAIACPMRQPAACAEVSLPCRRPMGPRQRLDEARLRRLQWAEGRAGWAARRWRCGPPGG